MPLRLGMLVYPLFFLVLLAGRRAGAISKFLDAGATSAERARRPESIGIKRRSDLAHLVGKGILKPESNGRFYVELRSLRRARQRLYSGCAAGVGCLIVTIMALHHWHLL